MVNLLTAEERVRIRQEESLRADIRKELNPASAEVSEDDWRVKLWKFLNSTFGIWFLSTVVVAIIANLYNERQAVSREKSALMVQNAIEDRRTKDNYQRVVLEISFRLSTTMARLKATSRKYENRLSFESQKSIAEAFDPLAKPAVDGSPSLYPEFKLYSGLALIAELQRYATDTERQSLIVILANTSGLIEDVVATEPQSNQSATAVASDLLLRMKYPKWSFNGFPYTSCQSTKPFC